ncbi:MAG: LysM peptidoglycan-binding domain-containing protein, partial [Actinomycetes bacterium]
LRGLAVDCTEQGRPLPKVRAARLTADAFDLYLAEPAVLPAPWQGSEDHIVWTLPGDAESQLPPPEPADIPAPYPALVTLGHDDEDGHVLVDLEYLGALGITGGDEATIRQVMAALAVELATSRWADDLQVTIVGAYAELEDGLETGRVRYMPAIGRLLDELQHRATRDREELVSRWAGDLNHARVTGAVPGAWTPEILLIPGDVNPAQREKIETLVAELPRVALAAVTSGPSVGEWNIRMTGTQTAVLEPYGLGLRPQMLDDATYHQVLQALAVTDEEPETTTWGAQPEPTLAEVDEVISNTHADLPAEETQQPQPPLEAHTEPTAQADETLIPETGGAEEKEQPHDPSADAAAAAALEDSDRSATVVDVDETVVDEAETPTT